MKFVKLVEPLVHSPLLPLPKCYPPEVSIVGLQLLASASLDCQESSFCFVLFCCFLLCFSVFHTVYFKNLSNTSRVRLLGSHLCNSLLLGNWAAQNSSFCLQSFEIADSSDDLSALSGCLCLALASSGLSPIYLFSWLTLLSILSL